MKKRLSQRSIAWGCVLTLLCGTTLLTNTLLGSGFLPGTAYAGWMLPASSDAAYPRPGVSEPVSPLLLKPVGSATGREAVEAPGWPYVKGAADGSSKGIFLPGDGASPVMARLDEPSPPPPAPPSLPARPIEKPAPQPLSVRIVEYHLNAELDTEGKLIRATSSLTWKNPGTVPVHELYFHLYPNAFESKKTTFMKESGGKLREDASKDNNVGSMQIGTIKTEDGIDLTSRIAYVQPDDGNTDDHTLLKVPLAKAVGPGEKVTLNTDYTVKLPQVFARMGYAGDFVMAGQWFPKVAVYETKGTRGRAEEGWNLHQYHGNSEFYADFGIFDVRIKVPSSYKVAATGFPIRPAQDDGKTKTYAFYADDVHDFAWAASPHFIYYEEPYATPQLPGVRIKLYLDPKHEKLKARYIAAAKKALARYSQWYGSYPYSTLSIVVPPADGNGAGGMEYPTLITAWGAGEDNPNLELERVVVHEIGHQFFYGMAASNEFEEAWLDEGFTSYAEDRLMETEYGVRPNLLVEASYITAPAPLRLNSWSYKDHHHYAENVYTRAKLVLKEMERRVGADTMNKIMRTYFQRWKFKHPTSADFQQAVEDVTKTSWKEFFDQYVYNGMMVDYAVTTIQTNRITENGQTFYENKVQIQRHGGTYPNVPIRFHFADGTQVDKTWEGADSEVIMKLNHSAPIDWVALDPQHAIVLENKRINSFMKTNVDPKLSVRLNLGAVKLLETVLGWIAW
ncbi:M1 family metallopeptidase [Paenibacillus filicis]|uniref:M1 family metallopeptidase n=1 Tax=Paenibacillus gyeongsangnamensis TaxID=3388067 RepID=A0ABT4QCG2_9BACL|nr:M1 family metallopeptidase [Paenibacillus filicis]MCZ8514578.1 M1 family metallopeptidase [Paenibacillus filicis]